MSGNGETRMLERRVSNNRADLNSDQQMNYFLSWFQEWSDLQKSDFVEILASRVGGQKSDVPIVEMNGLNLKKPLSLFQCQLKLFKEWVNSWNDDQKEYLCLRLKDLDSNFYEKYEEFLKNEGLENGKPKDYFEPGVPPELVRASRKTSNNSSPNVSINGNNHENVEENIENTENIPNNEIVDENNEQNGDGPASNNSSEPLSTIEEDE